MFARFIILLVTLCCLFMLFEAAVFTPKLYHWQKRVMVCTHTEGLPVARCVLYMNDKPRETNPDCFEEINEATNTSKTYCRLQCLEADSDSAMQKTPNWNHDCVRFFTYQTERRRDDWYIWRSGACLNTTIKLEVHCRFPVDPRDFYEENRELFDASAK
uniref:Secreted protein n=1 Tax=Plectus sambesii TaxID=2011161 RepID=A0A914WH10_9BILA